MQSELNVKLLNGGEHFGILNQEFNPSSEQVDFFCTAEQRSTILPLAEICYIKFLGKPDFADSFSEDEFFEDITTRTGERFHLRLKKSGKRIPQGFYGYPVEIDSAFKAIFFTSEGLKKKSHEQPIGEVLSKQGLVEESDIKDALDEQKALRARKVGEIISEQTEVPQVVVEQAIVNATKSGTKKAQDRVGDILIEAGLVTKKQVEDALKEQASGKRKRIGLILIERGLITEDQLLQALAHKFGLKVIDLNEQAPSSEALKRVPRDMVERMQISLDELEEAADVSDVFIVNDEVPRAAEQLGKFTKQEAAD